MNEFSLGASTQLVTIAIRVKDRDKMIHFYQKVLGFDLKREENELAILGLKDQANELLWLEESPRAEAHFGEMKKLQHVSLVIPTIAELGDLYQRLVANKYPIQEALYDNGQISLLVSDPEGNQIEIYYGTNKVQSPEPLDAEMLLQEAVNKYPVLSGNVYFDKIHLNVPNVEKEQYFLSEVLGFRVQDERSGIHLLNEGKFRIGLSQGVGETIMLPGDEVHGLDFLKFTIAKEELLILQEHLKEINQDYFVDKKEELLTVYNTVGIEWWFIVKK